MCMYINSMRGMSVNVLVSGPHLAFGDNGHSETIYRVTSL